MKDLNVIRRLDMKKVLMAVAMTALVMNSAFAAEPRQNVVIENEAVTVGDVFSGVTHDAGFVLAPAPAYGKTLTLGQADLKRISDAFNLGWTPDGRLSQVTIRRSAQEIGSDAVEAALKESMAAQLKGQKVDMQISNGGATFYIPEGASRALDISNLKVDLAHGEFRATVSAASKTGMQSQDVSGRLYPVTSVPVLKNGLQQGDLITKGDIDYIDMRNADLGANVITDANKLVGLSPRRGISSFKPMTNADVVQPTVVKKGEMVTMTLSTPVMTLTMQGKALESGAEGDVVKIVNVSSNQAVEAVVTGLRSVEVRAPDSGT